jgi:hypothetical protein
MKDTGKRFFNFLSILFLYLYFVAETDAQSFLKSVSEKKFDINLNDRILSAISNKDGSSVLFGETGQQGTSGTRIFIMKVNTAGDVIWQNILGSGGDFRFKSACKSQAEGFCILGTKLDANDKKIIWVVRVGDSGKILWESTTGGGEKENMSDIVETSDNGVLICGSKEIKGDHDTDGWIVKFNKKGSVESQALFGTRYINDEFNSIVASAQGEYILSGFTSTKMGGEMVPYFVKIDFRGNKKWEKTFADLVRTVPSSSFIGSDGSMICLAKVLTSSGDFDKISKLVISTSGDLLNNVSTNRQLNISKNSYIRIEDGKMIFLSAAQDKSKISSDRYLIRVDNLLNPQWIKPVDIDNVTLESLSVSSDSDFIAGGSISNNADSDCELIVFKDISDTEIEKYVSQKLITSAGMGKDESRDVFRTRIGRAEYDNFVTRYTSEASKELKLIPEIYTRDANAPTDSRPSIIASFRGVDDSGGGEVVLKGKYYALLIAINDYKDPLINNLDKPISDAQKLFDVLVNEYLFEKENITFLKNPTREQIISSFDKLEKDLTKADNLLIFYAGHGYWNETTQKGYWLASDASKQNTANWIGNSSISDYIRSIPAKHTLLIADACFSGSIFKSRAAFGGLDKTAQKLYDLTSRKAMTSGTLTEVPDKSVFVEYLVKRLADNSESYLSSEQLFFSFKPAVLNNTENIPQFGVVGNAGDEGGDFLFIKKKK